jgi:hypothetical protein
VYGNLPFTQIQTQIHNGIVFAEEKKKNLIIFILKNGTQNTENGKWNTENYSINPIKILKNYSSLDLLKNY